MKNKKLKYIGIIFIGISILCITFGFRIKSATLVAGSDANIYHLRSLPYPFIQQISINSFAMSPALLIGGTAPSFIYRGLNDSFNSTPTQNGIIEIGYGRISRSTTGAVVDDYVSSGTYSEFDMLFNSEFAYYWGDGYGNTVDIGTAMRHELGHGIGLDHTTKWSSSLMYPTYSVNEIKELDYDTRDGIGCIYSGGSFCRNNEGTNTGNINFSNNFIEEDNKLVWSIDTENNSLIGFNIFKKDKKGDLISLNKKIIKYVNSRNSYSFSLKKEKNYEKTDYFIEIVGEKSTDARMLSFK